MLEALIVQDPSTARIVHSTLELLALSGGFMLYRHLKKRQGDTTSLWHSNGIWVVLGCLIGAGIGNKLVSALHHPVLMQSLWQQSPQAFMVALFSGQSVVGGLLGGWIGVELGKKYAGITTRTGDDFVVPILFGLIIGRLGCFLAGAYDGTWGTHSNLPWAVDFGDGPRHPAALYEMLLALLALASYPWWKQSLQAGLGLRFRALMVAYLVWRLLIDGLKPIPEGWPLGMAGIQWVCVVALGVMALFGFKSFLNKDASQTSSEKH